MKRLLAVLLASILIISAVPAFAFSDGEYKNGDVNMDNSLNVKAATMIQRSVARLVELDNTQKKAG